jgi:hypothetical protein
LKAHVSQEDVSNRMVDCKIRLCDRL